MKKLLTSIKRFLFLEKWKGQESLEDTIEMLESLGNLVSDCKDFEGLCYYVGSWVVKKYAPSWYWYTGSRTYPVPHPVLGPMESFQTKALYGISNYGGKRRSLAKHIRECVIRDYGHLLEGEVDA